jgi:hypothetical protein
MQEGHVPHIFSRMQKSVIPGSQHLQAAIPGVTSEYPRQPVLFVRMGTKETYAEKVYGDPYHPCGWPAYDGVSPSWSVFEAYDLLWERFKGRVIDENVTREYLADISKAYDLVLSTLPLPPLCENEKHEFKSVPYWILPRMTPADDAHREVVVYNGLPDDPWYRWSILGRKESLESTTPLMYAQQGLKAISNNCDCHPRVKRLGRWAQWKHGVLLHHAYQEAREILQDYGKGASGN